MCYHYSDYVADRKKGAQNKSDDAYWGPQFEKDYPEVVAKEKKAASKAEKAEAIKAAVDELAAD